MSNKDVIYDLETYKNCFTFTIALANNPAKIRTFEISDRKDDTEEMLKCLRNLMNQEWRMVGFNNIGFDYPILHEIMLKAAKAKSEGVKPKFTAKWIQKLAQEQINSTKDGGFPKLIKDELIPQVDL